MDFTLSQEQEALRDSVRRFAAAELPEAARRCEERDEPPDKEMLQRYAEMGLLGVNLDLALGGAGGSHLDAVLALEEVAKLSPALAFPIFESSFGPVLAIAHFASDELRPSPSTSSAIACGWSPLG